MRMVNAAHNAALSIGATACENWNRTLRQQLCKQCSPRPSARRVTRGIVVAVRNLGGWLTDWSSVDLKGSGALKAVLGLIVDPRRVRGGGNPEGGEQLGRASGRERVCQDV